MSNVSKIEKILDDESIKNRIKADMKKTRFVGYKETWKLGVITPDIDKVIFTGTDRAPTGVISFVKSLSHLEQLSLRKTVVLYAPAFFGLFLRTHNITVTGGDVKQLYPLWSYTLETRIRRGEYLPIGDIKVRALPFFRDNIKELQTPFFGKEPEAMPVPQFLRRQGFPLKESYYDGDPLTTERGGIIVSDGDIPTIKYPTYFVQRSLIDDEGALICLGLDEEPIISDDVKIRPATLKKLAKLRLKPKEGLVLRYHSFPYESETMIPIIDTPVSSSGWGDLVIDTKGNARLFVAKEKSPDEWQEMMNKLKELLVSELSKKDYHLLGLTKDETHLNEYLMKKAKILEDYFNIENLGDFELK